MESKICPVCGSLDLTIIRKYRSSNRLFNHSFLNQCKVCELVFAWPLPSDEDLYKYNSNYFFSAHGGISRSRDSEAFFEGMAIIRYKYLENHLNINSTESFRVLEIGPGGGHLAKHILDKNSNIFYDAIEMDEQCHSNLILNGVNVRDFNSLDCQYDLIIISHVLEHVAMPCEFLGRYQSFLKANGCIFIEVPCRDWVHKDLDEPHLLFFEKKSFFNLFNQLSFDVIDIGYFGKTIDSLTKNGLVDKCVNITIRGFIKLRLEAVLGVLIRDLNFLPSSLHKLVIKTTNAHIRSSQPAWWLRVILKRAS